MKKQNRFQVLEDAGKRPAGLGLSNEGSGKKRGQEGPTVGELELGRSFRLEGTPAVGPSAVMKSIVFQKETAHADIYATNSKSEDGRAVEVQEMGA